MQLIQHIINGQHTSGVSKQTTAVFNPALGQQSAKVVTTVVEDVNAAVAAAQAAFPAWS